MFVAGIDVGGERKGFHAVVSKDGQYHAKFKSQSPSEMASWVHSFNPAIIAIDSPCKFAVAGESREAERDLMREGIRSFFTPTEEAARNSYFYDWVFNGKRLYEALGFPIFFEKYESIGLCIETFPNAVEKLILKEKGISLSNTKSKSARRRGVLDNTGYSTKELSNLDFVDAALCSLAAYGFHIKNYRLFGSSEEGFIVTPMNLVGEIIAD